MVWGSGERKVDVCILHKSMVWCSPKLFSRSFIFGSNELHEEPGEEKWLKCSNWSVTAELLRCNEAVILICICGFSDGCFGQTPAKWRDVKQASGGWKAAEEEDYRVRPTYLSLSVWITCNLKKKNPLILFHTIKLCFFCIKEVKSRLSHVLRSLVKIPCWLLWVLTFSICPDWKVLERPQTCSEQWGRKWEDLSQPAEATGAMEGKVTVKRDHSVIIQINVTGDICRK